MAFSVDKLLRRHLCHLQVMTRDVSLTTSYLISSRKMHGPCPLSYRDPTRSSFAVLIPPCRQTCSESSLDP